jgi:hypothetical protein
MYSIGAILGSCRRVEYLRQHTTDLVDKFEFSGFAVLEIESGVPVRGLVLSDSARGTIAVDQLFASYRFRKRCNVLDVYRVFKGMS